MNGTLFKIYKQLMLLSMHVLHMFLTHSQFYLKYQLVVYTFLLLTLQLLSLVSLSIRTASFDLLLSLMVSLTHSHVCVRDTVSLQ